MTTIAFFCADSAVAGQIAAGFLDAKAEPGVQALSVSLNACQADPIALKIMQDRGLAVSISPTRTFENLDSGCVDLIITLCGYSAEICPILPGYPEQVDWNIANTGLILEYMNDNSSADAVCDVIKRLVDDFFDCGYFSALTKAKGWSDEIIDNISDGLIAHNLDRKIFFFNKAAEQITGYSRQEVLGKDCHAVFPGNFCGGKCHFCDGGKSLIDGTVIQELDCVTKSGEKRSLNMAVKMISDSKTGRDSGVLATFHDVTREKDLAKRLGERDHFAGIIGRDKKMLEIFDLIRDLADTDAPVIIQGDSGTGKELVAAAIHNEGPRAGKLFVPVNCGALPESLLESELFGHVKGAFTGAIRDKKGRFELADGGTIFLDEIGDIPLTMQVKLLRVLQEGTFERVGSETTVKVDVRLISATNKDLIQEIDAGRFREDLYYRLSVVPVYLPPLRERRNDIPLLVEHVLQRELERTGREPLTVSSEALDIMMSYDWPGNIRELQNWIQFALVKCKSGSIEPLHLPPVKKGQRPAYEPALRKRKKLDVLTVRAALEATGGNKQEAAKNLGVSRATLYRFLDDVGEL